MPKPGSYTCLVPAGGIEKSLPHGPKHTAILTWVEQPHLRQPQGRGSGASNRVSVDQLARLGRHVCIGSGSSPRHACCSVWSYVVQRNHHCSELSHLPRFQSDSGSFCFPGPQRLLCDSPCAQSLGGQVWRVQYNIQRASHRLCSLPQCISKQLWRFIVEAC